MVERVILKNLYTQKSVLIDKDESEEYVLDYIDWGTVQSSRNTYKGVKQIGVYVTSTSLETRDINIYGWIIANTVEEMNVRKQFLNNFINPQQEIEVTYNDYTINFLPNNSIAYATDKKENNDTICKFNISGCCYDPLFEDRVETKMSAANTNPAFHFPLIMSKEPNPPGGIIFGEKSTSKMINVYNKGSFEIGMKVTFVANGTLTNPIIIDVNTQKYLKINKEMVAGEVIEIETSLGKKKIEGTLNGIVSNYFKYRDLSSNWLQLQAGSNLFRYDAESNVEDLEVYIHFTNKYLEVQQCY